MSQDVNWTYSLTVTADSTPMSTLQLNESHYVFSSQSSPSSCEVYNFSVTATPLGATYTGDGCSVLSPVLSRMLPSLPDVTTLESTIIYSLRYESDSTDGFVLTVHFKVKRNCFFVCFVLHFLWIKSACVCCSQQIYVRVTLSQPTCC